MDSFIIYKIKIVKYSAPLGTLCSEELLEFTNKIETKQLHHSRACSLAGKYYCSVIISLSQVYRRLNEIIKKIIEHLVYARLQR